MTDFSYEDLLPVGADETPYRLLTTQGVSVADGPGGRRFLQVEPEDHAEMLFKFRDDL